MRGSVVARKYAHARCCAIISLHTYVGAMSFTVIACGASPTARSRDEEREAALRRAFPGVVEEGVLADLLLVDRDPLANVKVIDDPAKNFLVERGRPRHDARGTCLAHSRIREGAPHRHCRYGPACGGLLRGRCRIAAGTASRLWPEDLSRSGRHCSRGIAARGCFCRVRENCRWLCTPSASVGFVACTHDRRPAGESRRSATNLNRGVMAPLLRHLDGTIIGRKVSRDDTSATGEST
jgi:hypothetical protein